MSYKKQVLKLIFILSLILLVIMVFNYTIDPFQQFRINQYGRGEQRKINPGIAKNYKFDSVVIGTSTSQNIHKKDIKKYFNIENAVNLSMAGSTATEQEQLLSLAMRYNDVKLVIYGLDMFSYSWNPGTVRSRIPDYLYNENKLLKIKYLLNVETLNKSLSALRRVLKGKQDITWIDNHGYHQNKGEYKKENVYGAAKNDGKIIQKTEYNFEIMCKNLDNFLSFMAQKKDVEYKIYFVPYSLVWWYYAEKYGKIEDILKFRYYVVNELDKYDNIELYEFQNVSEIIDENNFKDTLHISPEKSKEIIQKIYKKENKILKKEYSKIISEFLEKLDKNQKKYKELNL